MHEALGTVLPNAVAIAISPIPIIAVILMLMSPHPQQLGLAFLAGWLAGVIVATSVMTLLADAIPEPDDSGASQPVIGVIRIALGALLLLLGMKQWRARPAPDAPAKLPAWMSKIDSIGVPAALGLAFALAAVNPKNLLVAAAAGTVIGRASLDVGSMAITIALFTIIAGATVGIPVLFAVTAPRKAAPVLENLRIWLAAHNASIMTVVFFVLGASVIGKGISAF